MEIGREFLSTNGTNRHEKGKGKLGRDFNHGWTQTNTDSKWELGRTFNHLPAPKLWQAGGIHRKTCVILALN